MNKKAAQDNIDLELSKTYFGNSRKTGKPASSPSSRERSTAPKKTVRSKKPLVIATIAMTFLVIAGIYIFGYKKVSLSVKVETRPVEQKPLYTTSRSPRTIERGKDRTIYDFEKSEDGWEIPYWALEKDDHVGLTLSRTVEVASNGTGSLKLDTDFPGSRWTAALIEIQQFLDLTDYISISTDVFLPPGAPEGLRAKLIVTVGETWKFVEMARSVRLKPGEWTTITAKISDGSTDWKRTVVDKAFREDVRKVAIRIESNNKPIYAGPIYVDDIRVTMAAE
ncbi:MAG: hypothetical protein P9L88_03830 [Candidatus Tantalella remota]|nr:hypothetical protein [Candidatus Tantalella remota]